MPQVSPISGMPLTAKVSFGITMETVYIDESGYTGYDLLNENQPF